MSFLHLLLLRSDIVSILLRIVFVLLCSPYLGVDFCAVEL